MSDLAERLGYLLERLRTVYDGIGHSSGRPYVYFVYPPDQERALRRLVDEQLRDETPGLLDSPLGRLLCLADVYDQLASDVPIETKTDLNRVAATVPDATPLTTRVARALFLLGKVQEYVPTTLPNVARALVDSLDADLGALREAARAELDRLVRAGYAKQVGDQYVFLSTQQRGFQDRVRARQEELHTATYELSQALKEYDAEDALRFDRVA
ncbi:MAG TPA: hypothetical protein VGJ32_08205, partial [Solirubrobacteraceae bacterium]